MAIKTHYEIEHTCGHTVEVDLSKKPAGKRAGLAQWLHDQPCLECKHKAEGKQLSAEVKAEREAEKQEAVEFAAKLELPDLTGSAKQQEKLVPWAFTVRHGLLKGAYTAFVESGEWSEDDFETRLLEPAREVDYCGWWVDNREADAADLQELLETANDDEDEDSDSDTEN